MNLLNSSKLVSRSLIGAVGLSASAIALLGAPETANALIGPQKGTDYFISPMVNGNPGSSFVVEDIKDFNDKTGASIPVDLSPLVLPLMGTPLDDPFPGETDTVVQRKEDCIFSDNQCTISIEMTELSLKGFEPVSIPVEIEPDMIREFEYSIFATLNEETPTEGKMLIRDDGTFDSFLNVYYKVVFTPIEADAPDLNNFLGKFVQDDPTNMIPAEANGALKQLGTKWGNTPTEKAGGAILVHIDDPLVMDMDQDPNCHTPSSDGFVCADDDFFVVDLSVVQHEKGSPLYPDGHATVTITVDPVENVIVPEPSAIAPLALFGLAGIWGVKKKQSLK